METTLILIATVTFLLAMAISFLVGLGYDKRKTWASKLRFTLFAVAVATFAASICSFFGLMIGAISAVIVGVLIGFIHGFMGKLEKTPKEESEKITRVGGMG